MFKSIAKFCKRSVTVAWGYLQILVGLIFALIHAAGAFASDLVSNPSVKEALSQLTLLPKWVIPVLIVFGYVTVSARIHSANPVQVMNNAPVKNKR